MTSEFAAPIALGDEEMPQDILDVVLLDQMVNEGVKEALKMPVKVSGNASLLDCYIVAIQKLNKQVLDLASDVVTSNNMVKGLQEEIDYLKRNGETTDILREASMEHGADLQKKVEVLVAAIKIISQESNDV